MQVQNGAKILESKKFQTLHGGDLATRSRCGWNLRGESFRKSVSNWRSYEQENRGTVLIRSTSQSPVL